MAAAPPDPIFDISNRYKADPAALKLNLGVGAYRTDAGGAFRAVGIGIGSLLGGVPIPTLFYLTAKRISR